MNKMWKKIFSSLSFIIILAIISIGINFGHTNADSFADSLQQGILPTLAEQLPEPPPGFNPLTATSADLQKYGFPEKPTSETALKNWEDAMANAKEYVKPVQIPSRTVHGLVGTTDSVN